MRSVRLIPCLDVTGGRVVKGVRFVDLTGDGYWLAIASTFIAKLKAIPDAFLAFWKSDQAGMPCNGGSAATPASVGKVEEISGPLEICTARGLHATLDPDKHKGERIWLVALYGEVQRSEDKVASLKREILAEIK